MLILLPPSEKKNPTTKPTPAINVYTGVLYQALGWASLSAAAKKRGASAVVIISAKYGAVRPDQLIESYKAKIDNSAMRTPVAKILDAIKTPLIVDCRSSTYKGVWPINSANTIEVRVFQVVAGERKVITHMSKKYRGELTRHLLTQATDPITPADVQRMAAQLFECELHPPADAQPWALDLLIS